MTLETLQSDELHLWRIPLAPAAEAPNNLADVLSPDERARAARFRFERDRIRYVAARTGLRLILSAYGAGPPEALDFQYGAHGKPFLPDLPPQFNLSHSGDLALCALAIGCRVGVDLERPRAVSHLEQIVQRICTQHEREALLSPGGERTREFFRVWTRKEAVLKGLGTGMSGRPQAIDVRGDTVRFVAPPHAGATLPATGRWWVTDLTLDAGYVGAVAAEGPARRIVYRRW